MLRPISELTEQGSINGISSDYIRFWLSQEEDAGNPENIENQSGKVITSVSTPSSPVSFSGTVGTTWSANTGWCTPAGALTWIHTLPGIDDKDDLLNFFELSTLSDVGGILIVFDLYTGTQASGADYIFAASRGANGTRGGYGCYYNNTRVFLEIYMNGGTAVRQCFGEAISADTHYQMAFYIDCVNHVVTAYKNGAITTSGTTTKTLDNEFPSASYPTLNANRGVTLLCRDAGGGGTSNPFGGVNATARVSDLNIFRIESDMSGSIPDIISGIYSSGWHRIGKGVSLL